MFYLKLDYILIKKRLFKVLKNKNKNINKNNNLVFNIKNNNTS